MDEDEENKWLSCLNANQLNAVQQPSNISLQILAGPGSGRFFMLGNYFSLFALGLNEAKILVVAYF
jgi:hypothetical protein